MHELALWSIPLLGVPFYAAQRWFARRHMSRTGLALDEPLMVAGKLPSATGSPVDLGALQAKALVFVFMSNRCPGVKAYDRRLNDLVRRFEPQGVAFVGVNSVPQSLYPSENLGGMKRAAQERQISFPYVKDEDQQLMRLLGAVCTPQVFLLDERRVLRYRGRIDDAFIEAKARSHDLRDALNDVLADRPVKTPETPALGCTIDLASNPFVPSSTQHRSIPA